MYLYRMWLPRYLKDTGTKGARNTGNGCVEPVVGIEHAVKPNTGSRQKGKLSKSENPRILRPEQIQTLQAGPALHEGTSWAEKKQKFKVSSGRLGALKIQ